MKALTRPCVTNIFQLILGKTSIEGDEKQKQVGAQDCGLFAVAIATAILFGKDTPAQFNQKIMRDYLLECFEDTLLK